MNSPGSETEGTGSRRVRNSAARLAAVQALYQIELGGNSSSDVIEQFLRYRLDDLIEGEEIAKPSKELFVEIVRGVVRRRDEIDEILSSALTADWPLDRLERILRCILRSGVYELLASSRVPARSVISEYVDLTSAFYGGSEPGMANGILDRLARKLRAEEFDGNETGRETVAGSIRDR